MPFVTQVGSKQYIVENNQKFAVDRITDAKEGDSIDLPVLFSYGENSKAKTVKVKILSHTKGKKIRVVKFRSKSNYHRQYGFRPYLSILQVISQTAKSDKSDSKEDSEKTLPKSKEQKVELPKENLTKKIAE